MRWQFLFMEASSLSDGVNGGLPQSPGNDIMDGKRETVGGMVVEIETEGGAVILWRWTKR